MNTQKNKLADFILTAHLSEKDLNRSRIEQVSDLDLRKSTGSFYTPIDVALFVWNTVFEELDQPNNNLKLKNFFCNYDVVEPSNGGGAFLFSYLQVLSNHGLLSEWENSPQVIFVNDINSGAVIDFLTKIDDLGLSKKFRFFNQDGRTFLKELTTNLKPCIIGNPPYFKQKSDGYSNIYADFVDCALDKILELNGIVSLLVPLSITFSKHFVQLRTKMLESDTRKKFVNFDNMPDYVFRQGKSDSLNTNKAISQRISLVTINANKVNKVFSTPLISWKASDRKKIFTEPKVFFETTPIGRLNIIPKPISTVQINQLQKLKSLRDFVMPKSEAQNFKLYFGTTARNFLSVGLTKFRETGISDLIFENSQIRDAMFYFLASKDAWQLWRALGDGFHVTKENLLLFSVPEALINDLEAYAEKGKNLWNERGDYRGTKVNLGKKNFYYNFVGSTGFCCPK